MGILSIMLYVFFAALFGGFLWRRYKDSRYARNCDDYSSNAPPFIGQVVIMAMFFPVTVTLGLPVWAANKLLNKVMKNAKISS